MDKFFKWLKNRKNWKWLIIGAFAIFFIPLLIIHLLFKIPCINDFFAPAWTAGDLLGYVGAFYALLATAIFSSLTLWQNHLLREKTEAYQKILDQENRKRNMPELIVEISGANGFFTNLVICVLNDSENIAKFIIIDCITILDEQGGMFYKKENLGIRRNALKSGDKIEIELKNPPIKNNNYSILISVQFEDKFTEWHEFTTKFIVTDFDKFKFKTIPGKAVDIDNPMK